MENEFMFKDKNEYIQLAGGVLSYLQRDINKLLKSKNLNAEFINIGTDKDNVTWLLFKVYYTTYKDNNDMFGKESYIWLVYPITELLFTRHPERMTYVDKKANILSRRDNFSDIDLVKLRILYHIFTAIQAVQKASFKISKRVIIADYSTGGVLTYDIKDNLPDCFN